MEKKELEFIPKNPQFLSIWDLGLCIFKELFLENKTLDTHIVNSILFEVYQDRNGFPCNRNLLRNAVFMLYEVDPTREVYRTRFEEPFMAASLDFFRMNAQEIFKDSDINSYLKLVLQLDSFFFIFKNNFFKKR